MLKLPSTLNKFFVLGLRFYHSVKTQALLLHTGNGSLSLLGGQSHAFFGAWLLPRTFFVFEVKWYAKDDNL